MTTGRNTQLPAGQPPSTTAKAITAVRWTLAGNIAQRLVTFGAVALLARILSETEFGAYRQLLSVHLVLFVLLPLGFDQLYVREVRHRRRFLLLLGGALTFSAAGIAVFALTAHPLLVRWLSFGPWAALLWAAPAIVALQAAKLIYKTDLAARLAYREISIGETLYALVSGLVGVGLALLSPAAWTLYLAYGLAEVTELIWVSSRSRVSFPPILLSLAMLKRRGARWARFGLFHCGNQVFNALGSNAPVIIFGASLSKAAAAAFSMANWLITIPIYILIGALHKVAFSALAGRDRHALMAPVLQMLRLSAAFIVPVLIWVAVMAEPIVAIVLGDKWVDSTAPVARLLSLYCIFASLFSPISSLDILLDRPDYGFYWNVVATAIRVAAVILGLRYGVMHAVVAYALSSAVLWFIWGVMLASLLGAGQWVFHSAWLRLSPLWLVLGLMLWGTTVLFSHPIATLAASVIPAAIYAGALITLNPDIARQGKRLLRLS